MVDAVAVGGDGFAVAVGVDGRIHEVLANTFGPSLNLAAGEPLAAVFDSGCLAKYDAFLAHLRSGGDAFDWELNLVVGDQVTPVSLYATEREGSLLIMGATTRRGLLQMLDEFVSINSELVTTVRDLRRQLAGPGRRQSDVSIDELMRLNNELTNLQREMAKRNVELQRSNRFSQSILDTTPDLIFIYDLASRRLTAVNRSLEGVLGFSSQVIYARGGDLKGLLLSAEQQGVMEAKVAELLGRPVGDLVEWDAETWSADDQPVWLRIRATQFEVLPTGEARTVLVAATDITLEHKAQAALARSAERLRAVMDTMLDPHLVLAAVRDQSGEIVDFEVTDANPAAGTLDGTTAEEMIGVHLLERFPRWAVDDAIGEQKRVVETGEPLVRDDVPSPFDAPESRRRLDLRSVRLDDGVSMTVRDATARYAAERAVRQRVAELDALQRMSALLVQRVDLATALDSVCGLLAALFGAATVRVQLLGAGEGEDPVGAAYVVPGVALPDDDGAGEAAIAGALANGRVVVATDRQGAHLLAVPLVATNEKVGVLFLCRAGRGDFTRDEQGVAATAADLLAAVIRSERLHQFETQQAALHERQLLARDLHDAVTQSIYSANLIAEALPVVFERHPEEALKELGVIRGLIRAAFAELRILLYELRPEALAAAPLETLLERLADALAGQGEVAVELEVDETLTLPSGVRVVMYRVAQEALSNVAKHAGASAVSVSVDRVGDAVRLTVRDDGRGFDPAAAHHASLGQSIMRERAAGIGADLSVESTSGAGTVVTLLWRDSQSATTAE